MNYSKYLKLFSFFFIIICFVGTLSAQSRPTQTVAGDTILVEIGDSFITYRDLRLKIDTLPSMQAPRFKTISGQQQILERMITEELFLKRALELGYDKLEEVQNAIFFYSQPISNEIYFEEVIKKDFRFDMRSVERYYNENIQIYTVLPRITIQHLQTDAEGLETVQKAINDGEDFLLIIESFSNNSATAGQRGMVRNIRFTGFISGIGQDPVLDRHIHDAEVDLDKIYGPFETDTGIHFFKKLEHEPMVVRPFDEVKDEIEMRLRGQIEHELYQTHLAELMRRYNVIFMTDLLENYNIRNMTPEQRNSFVVQSSRPEINISFNDVERLLQSSASQEMRLDTSIPSVREMIVRSEMDKRILNAASADANIFELYKDRQEMQETRLSVILNYFYTTEITSKVEVSREELLEYYENNTERYTIPANRAIRQFVTTDERAARKPHSDINRMLRRGQHERIAEYIRQNSLHGQNGGFLEYVYQNNIVPTVGTDENYNKMIFEAKIGQLSKVFRNINDEVVFFYVVDEIPPRVRPLHEVESSLMNIISRQKATVLFEQVQEELTELYTVVTHFDRLVLAITPEELFHYADLAQRMGTLNDTIFYFDQIIKDFADTEHAYRALFMKGFVAAENMNNNEVAIEAFQTLIDDFEEGELHESARFMLEALKNNEPLEMFFGQ